MKTNCQIKGVNERERSTGYDRVKRSERAACESSVDYPATNCSVLTTYKTKNAFEKSSFPFLLSSLSTRPPLSLPLKHSALSLLKSQRTNQPRSLQSPPTVVGVEKDPEHRRELQKRLKHPYFSKSNVISPQISNEKPRSSF